MHFPLGYTAIDYLVEHAQNLTVAKQCCVTHVTSSQPVEIKGNSSRFRFRPEQTIINLVFPPAMIP